MDNDYIITVDENGQPYIAHAFGGHKYFQKILNGPKAIYFYTREQFENYLRRRQARRQMKQQQNWTVSNHGLTGRRRNVTGKANENWFRRRTID